MNKNEITIMLYNVEHMGQMFYKNGFAENEAGRISGLAEIIFSIKPHILCIVEAAKKEWMHQLFLEKTTLSQLGYRIARSVNDRGIHELVFYYREPLELVSLDTDIDFYKQWSVDIDNDGIEEIFNFERAPLEGVFRINGTDETFRLILASTKSKGVFVSADIMRYQALAIANRKKLLAQSVKIRERLDYLLIKDPHEKIIVAGDLNDDPGTDGFERMVGGSALETIMGSVFEPELIFHNTLHYWTKDKARGRELYTTEFHDPIVKNQVIHKSWIDHILISPGLRRNDQSLRYIEDSGMIAEKSDTARMVSDHFPIYCGFQWG